MNSERLVILIYGNCFFRHFFHPRFTSSFYHSPGIKAYVHNVLVQVQNRTSSTTYSRIPSMSAVENAVMQLYIRSGIDVQMLETYAECARYLLETTIVTARAMAPSSDSGRFSGIRKSKSTMHPSSGQKYYTGDVWLRHLDCIPGLSKKKARNVATRFPTLSSLLSHYSSLSTDQERHSALEDIISAGQKKERVISKRVYKVFTSSNADEPL